MLGTEMLNGLIMLLIEPLSEIQATVIRRGCQPDPVADIITHFGDRIQKSQDGTEMETPCL